MTRSLPANPIPAHGQGRRWHLPGDAQVVFGFWAMAPVVRMLALSGKHGASTCLDTRNYTEPMLVFVFMVIAGPGRGAPCAGGWSQWCSDPTRPSETHICSKGTSMKPRITVITLGVDDLERALRFYRDGLGFKTEGIIGTEFEHGAVVFIDMQAGLKLALWPRASLARDSGLALQRASATELSLGHNVASKAEVDGVMEQARQAGAVIVKPAQDTFWGGYAGYFQDPDQHLWEVVWNPQWEDA